MEIAEDVPALPISKTVAHIVDGVVVNTVLFGPDFEPDGTVYVDVTDQMVSQGDLFNAETSEFTRPEPEPAPVIVPEIISDRQFFQMLAKLNLISKDEALAAVMNGVLPQAFETFIGSLSEEQQFDARMLLSGATEFRRSHELTVAFGQLQGMDEAALDGIWIAASML